MEMLRKNRDVSRMAKCKACFAQLPGRRSNAPKHMWKQSMYKGTVCKSALPPSKFDTAKLQQWEHSDTLYLAQCGSCESVTEPKAQLMTCNLCFETKPADAFSPARQRHRDSKTRRCKDCDFPPCSSCGIIPTLPKQTPYMCPVCLFPPLCVRSGETAVDAKSRHGEADVAMRCLQRREGAASSVRVKLQITTHLFAVSVRMFTYGM